jgi:hypothetical protein
MFVYLVFDPPRPLTSEKSEMSDMDLADKAEAFGVAGTKLTTTAKTFSLFVADAGPK